MWVARDKDESLWLYTSKPIRLCGVHRWRVEIGDALNNQFKLCEEIFPSLRWDNEPVEVKLIRSENKIKEKMYVARDKDGYLFVHNHPSGYLKPSIDDDKVTKNIQNVASIMGCKFIDHVIVTNEGYFSYIESGKLF
ncbi:MAG: hypothetical protein J5767_12595 [Paludibacteraceae bacterium]|nr:hypothetical protein [Paludibacteraceae bacterium]